MFARFRFACMTHTQLHARVHDTEWCYTGRQAVPLICRAGQFFGSQPPPTGTVSLIGQLSVSPGANAWG